MMRSGIGVEAPQVSQAVILAGGLGTRLRSVCADIPKPMIPVHGRPFLDYIVEYIWRQGIGDIVISSGYKGDQIETFFSQKPPSSPCIRCLREEQLLGTGGALAYAVQKMNPGRYLLACNGDSLAPFLISTLIAGIAKGADAAIVAVRNDDCSQFGSLDFDASGRLTSFGEKRCGQKQGFINAGVYLLDIGLLPNDTQVRAASLERDFFPQWISEGRNISVLPIQGPFIDIGTPESLSQASAFIRNCGLFLLE